MSDIVFECRGAGFTHREAEEPVLVDVDLEVEPGTFTAIIGPNGAGKTTLMRLLSGVIRPTTGSVAFRGRSLDDWSRTDLARRLAVVSQDGLAPVPQTVFEYASLGRNPYVSAWASLSSNDNRVVTESLEVVGLLDLATRAVTDLSGGELQRARLGRALAQEPSVLLLDEPTAHLDIGHGLRAFTDVARLVQGGMTVVCVTHDLNLASRFADRLVLLDRGRVVGDGTADSVLDSSRLAAAYECGVEVADLGAVGRVVLPAESEAVGAAR